MNKVIICGNPDFNKNLKMELWHRYDIKATAYDATSHEEYPQFETIIRQIKKSEIVILQTQPINADISMIVGLARGYGKFIIGLDCGNDYPQCYFTYDVCDVLYDDEGELLADMEEYI